MLLIGEPQQGFSHHVHIPEIGKHTKLNSSTYEMAIPIRLDFIFRLRTGLTPSQTNDCKKAALAAPLAHHQGGKPWP